MADIPAGRRSIYGIINKRFLNPGTLFISNR